MRLKAERNFAVSIILCASNFYNPTTYNGPPRIKELFEAGCRIRTHKPKRGRYPLMHIKTIITDSSEVLTGSCNMTSNGIENNEEHLLTVGDPGAVSRAVKQFERLWNEADEVGSIEIQKMMTAYSEYQERKNQEVADRARSDAIAAHYLDSESLSQ